LNDPAVSLKCFRRREKRQHVYVARNFITQKSLATCHTCFPKAVTPDSRLQYRSRI
jgi:hypothetical protein